MASPTDFLLGKAKRPSGQEQIQAPEVPRGSVNASNCVHFDNSAADFGGNQNATLGQDGAMGAFDRFLRQSQEDVARFNEKLTHEQTKPSPGQ
jgi:hypothetical protein